MRENTKHKQKNVIVLGSTGSIGKSALDIIRHHPTLRCVALSCQSNLSLLIEQVQEFKPLAVTLTSTDPALTFQLKHAGATGLLPANLRIYQGKDSQGKPALLSMIEETEAEIVLNGIAGAGGLLPSLCALETGKDLALANKETIVMAGPLMLKKARELKKHIIPVDSEHAALFHLLKHIPADNINEILLTASGGSFRDFTYEQLKNVSVEAALKHPTWQMGTKITIDSATMANKGLEVIEAMYLFGIGIERIKVLIHPQSYVHALVRTRDNNLYAEISQPDMRIPIQNALTFPEILPPPLEPFDLTCKSLTFAPWDKQKYELLGLAYEVVAHRDPGVMNPFTIVYNAANEIAVAAFVKGEIPYLDIAATVKKVLAKDWDNIKIDSINDILYIDDEVRIYTKNIIRSYV
jgi:1-deoxy-D-xylulose-5-phosphate reductoisomerase